jgi:hypothetical protein
MNDLVPARKRYFVNGEPAAFDPKHGQLMRVAMGMLHQLQARLVSLPDARLQQLASRATTDSGAVIMVAVGLGGPQIQINIPGPVNSVEVIETVTVEPHFPTVEEQEIPLGGDPYWEYVIVFWPFESSPLLDLIPWNEFVEMRYSDGDDGYINHPFTPEVDRQHVLPKSTGVLDLKAGATTGFTLYEWAASGSKFILPGGEKLPINRLLKKSDLTVEFFIKVASPGDFEAIASIYLQEPIGQFYADNFICYLRVGCENSSYYVRANIGSAIRGPEAPQTFAFSNNDGVDVAINEYLHVAVVVEGIGRKYRVYFRGELIASDILRNFGVGETESSYPKNIIPANHMGLLQATFETYVFNSPIQLYASNVRMTNWARYKGGSFDPPYEAFPQGPVMQRHQTTVTP